VAVGTGAEGRQGRRAAADGTYRLMPKGIPGSQEPLALSAVGSSSPTLSAFRAGSDRHSWIIRTP